MHTHAHASSWAWAWACASCAAYRRRGHALRVAFLVAGVLAHAARALLHRPAPHSHVHPPQEHPHASAQREVATVAPSASSTAASVAPASASAPAPAIVGGSLWAPPPPPPPSAPAEQGRNADVATASASFSGSAEPCLQRRQGAWACAADEEQELGGGQASGRLEIEAFFSRASFELRLAAAQAQAQEHVARAALPSQESVASQEAAHAPPAHRSRRGLQQVRQQHQQEQQPPLQLQQSISPSNGARNDAVGLGVGGLGVDGLGVGGLGVGGVDGGGGGGAGLSLGGDAAHNVRPRLVCEQSLAELLLSPALFVRLVDACLRVPADADGTKQQQQLQQQLQQQPPQQQQPQQPQQQNPQQPRDEAPRDAGDEPAAGRSRSSLCSTFAGDARAEAFLCAEVLGGDAQVRCVLARLAGASGDLARACVLVRRDLARHELDAFYAPLRAAAVQQPRRREGLMPAPGAAPFADPASAAAAAGASSSSSSSSSSWSLWTCAMCGAGATSPPSDAVRLAPAAAASRAPARPSAPDSAPNPNLSLHSNADLGPSWEWPDAWLARALRWVEPVCQALLVLTPGAASSLPPHTASASPSATLRSGVSFPTASFLAPPCPPLPLARWVLAPSVLGPLLHALLLFAATAPTPTRDSTWHSASADASALSVSLSPSAAVARSRVRPRTPVNGGRFGAGSSAGFGTRVFACPSASCACVECSRRDFRKSASVLVARLLHPRTTTWRTRLRPRPRPRTRPRPRAPPSLLASFRLLARMRG
jgi:hypothetical protein